MPLPRRGRRRPPFLTSRWQRRTLESLRLYLAPTVRATLTAWMKIYGETNDLPGLVTGPIEVRFRRLCEHSGADTLLLWTTPDRWAAGEGLSLLIPAIGLDLECRFDEGRLHVEKAKPTGADDRDPRKQRTAVGMELHPALVELPSEVEDGDAGPTLEGPFERMLGRRFHGFVGPLREALEAEARDDTTRAEKLQTTYQVANPRIGGSNESDPYRLAGIDGGAVAQFDEGEWLDLVDGRGRVTSSARLVRIDPAEGVMDIDVRGSEPPSAGSVRPRPQTQILAQKRAILDELDNPTGGLRDAVRLVASPASLPIPRKIRPETFVNRLVMHNRSQTRAVSLALGLEDGQALMVQGPPGTGKSTTLAEILGQLVMREPNVSVLVCSHSNHGVDNLLLKTLPYLDSIPALQVARVGLFDRVHPQARKHFVPPGEDLGAYNVVFTTVDALALQAEAGARQYDYAVLDEANRASILDSLIPLVRGKRFILVGDHLQLQPVLSEAEEQLRLEPAAGGNNSAIGKSLFAWLRERRFPEAAAVFLDEQNRMHPVIAGLISEVFYEGKLRSGRKAPRRPAQVPLFNTPVVWVDTHGLHGLREVRGRGASLVNVPEARLVATIARHLMATAQPDVEIGVIAAYAEQTALLRRLLTRTNRPMAAKAPAKAGAGGAATGPVGGPEGAGVAGAAPNGTSGSASGGDGTSGGNGKNGRAAQIDRAALRKLEVDTVDAFEGREKDIIIVSLVRSNRRRDIGFLRLMQRINVALSRARTMLVIVGDTSTLRGSYFDRIVRYVRANGALVPGPRLIGRLLNARSTDRPQPIAPRRRARPLARPAFPDREVPAGVPTGQTADGQEDSAARRKRRRRRVRGRGPNDGRDVRPNDVRPNQGPAGDAPRPPDAPTPSEWSPTPTGPIRPGRGPRPARGVGPSSGMGPARGARPAQGARPARGMPMRGLPDAPGAAAASGAGSPPELGVVRQAPTPFSPLSEPPTPFGSLSGPQPAPPRPSTDLPTPAAPAVPHAGATPATPGVPSPDASPEAAQPRRRTRRAVAGVDEVRQRLAAIQASATEPSGDARADGPSPADRPQDEAHGAAQGAAWPVGSDGGAARAGAEMTGEITGDTSVGTPERGDVAPRPRRTRRVAAQAPTPPVGPAPSVDGSASVPPAASAAPPAPSADMAHQAPPAGAAALGEVAAPATAPVPADRPPEEPAVAPRRRTRRVVLAPEGVATPSASNESFAPPREPPAASSESDVVSDVESPPDSRVTSLGAADGATAAPRARRARVATPTTPAAPAAPAAAPLPTASEAAVVATEGTATPLRRMRRVAPRATVAETPAGAADASVAASTSADRMPTSDMATVANAAASSEPVVAAEGIAATAPPRHASTRKSPARATGDPTPATVADAGSSAREAEGGPVVGGAAPTEGMASNEGAAPTEGAVAAPARPTRAKRAARAAPPAAERTDTEVEAGAAPAKVPGARRARKAGAPAPDADV